MIKAELGRFGDKRLACVGGALLAAMQRKRTFCLHRLAKDRNQTIQFGRFLTNPAVTAREMLATTARLTNRRAAGRHVLAIMDTTELDFPSHEASKHGFGNCGNGEHPGLFLHPVLAVDADKAGVIGLLDCAVMNRTEGKVSDHKKRGADDKESRRRLHGAEMAADGLADAAMITVVGDRESDIYDLFARRPANVHLLCRSAQARALTTGGLLPEYCATPRLRRGMAARTGARHHRGAGQGQAAGAPSHGGDALRRGLPEAPGNRTADHRSAPNHRSPGGRCARGQPARGGGAGALAAVDHT
jgi:hypothetical protein